MGGGVGGGGGVRGEGSQLRQTVMNTRTTGSSWPDRDIH